jgi:hypothetical protein
MERDALPRQRVSAQVVYPAEALPQGISFAGDGMMATVGRWTWGMWIEMGEGLEWVVHSIG